MSPQEKRQRTLVKVCGARSPEVAEAALQAGADAVGVVAVPGSVREVSPSEALRISRVAPDRTVLVLRDPDADRLELARIWPGPVQFHAPFPIPARHFIHAVSGPPPSEPGPGQTAWLLDAPTAGSGEAWAWPAADRMPVGLPVILAGGLDPDNVAQAIRCSLPWAVDVSSGVERNRGTKDAGLIRAFVHAVQACDQADGRTLPPLPADFAALR